MNAPLPAVLRRISNDLLGEKSVRETARLLFVHLTVEHGVDTVRSLIARLPQKNRDVLLAELDRMEGIDLKMQLFTIAKSLKGDPDTPEHKIAVLALRALCKQLGIERVRHAIDEYDKEDTSLARGKARLMAALRSFDETLIQPLDGLDLDDYEI